MSFTFKTDNGKTTLLSTIQSLFEEYSAVLQVDTLMLRREETNNSQADPADLRGVRFAMTSETEDGQRLSAAKIKRITQDKTGKIKSSRKHENPIVFPETRHLWMDSNFKPLARAGDDALWNRIHLIPFYVTIPKQEQDRSLSDRFRKEAEGIIAWIVEGARRWFKEGLGKPLDVAEAGNAWRAESDVLTPFVEEFCELSPDAQAPLGGIWNAYQTWAAENSSHRILDRTEFNRAPENRGHKKGRCRNSRFWVGLGLKKIRR